MENTNTAQMANLDIKDFTQVNGISKGDCLLMVLSSGMNGRIPGTLLLDILTGKTKPGIGEDGHWYIGGTDTGVVAEGRTPQLTLVDNEIIAVRYSSTEEWTPLVTLAQLRIDFNALTEEQRRQLKMNLEDLTQAEIKVLQKPATEAAEKADEARERIEKNEAERQANEKTRQSNETARVTAESQRTTQWNTLKSDSLAATTRANESAAKADTATAKAEQATSKAQEATQATIAAKEAVEKNEQSRQDAEAVRQANETARVNAESQRGTNEQSRINAESSRSTAEQARVDAESARVTEHNALKQASQKATSEAVKAKQDCDEATADCRDAISDLTQIKADVDASKTACDEATRDTIEAKEAIEEHEAQRQADELIRRQKETARQSAEESRVQAETQRAGEHASLKEASEQATAGAIQAKKDADEATATLEAVKNATVEATTKANQATSDTLEAKTLIESKEAERQADELVRQQKESERQSAEESRQTALDTHLSECTGKVNKLITDTDTAVSSKLTELEATVDTLGDTLTSEVEGAVAQAQTDISAEVTKARNATTAANTAASNANTQAGRAKAHADNPPKIGENGNWHLYSEAVGGYVDSGITAKVTTGDYATKAWVGQQGFLTSHQDISGLATKTALAELSGKLNDFLTGTDTDTVINKWKELEAFLAGYSESNTLASLLSGKADANHTHDYSGVYAAKSHNHDTVYAKVSDIPSLAGYATQQWVNQQGFLKQHQSLADYLKSADAQTLYQPKGSYAAASHTHSDYVTLSTAQTITGAKTFSTLLTATTFAATTAMSLSEGKVTGLVAGQTRIYGNGIAISNPATPNDLGWIRVTGTGETDTVLEIATGDDGGGGEQIVMRQYNTSNAVAHQIILMNTAGNQVLNTVTASSFIKSGGTSSQFLKADGSVDSSSYALSSHTHSYAASSHSHAIADVTGLQDALNGKAASSHTHSYLPTAGGTMSGTITFAALAGANGRTLLQQQMADNDYFRIYAGGTATNAGFAEIATADDGTEPIYVRQYTGVFATLKRTLTLLDASGNTVCPGTVTAAGFAKSGSSDSYLLLGGGGHKAVSDFALSGHTHNYAAASHSHPSSQISDLIKKTAVGDIGWGTAADQQKALAMSAIAFWNGAYQGSSSNLQYCDRGRFGTIITKSAGDYAAASHTHDYAASSHNHNTVYAPIAFSNFYEGANTVTTLASVPVTRRTVVATISANASFSLASTPAEGREVHIIVKNSGSADVTVAIPTTYIISGGEDTLSVPAGGYAEINVLSAGGKLYVRMAT